MDTKNNEEDTKKLTFVVIFLSVFVVLLFGFGSLT